MDWSDLLKAIALVLVIEGLLPFLSPRGFKQSMRQIENIPEPNLRVMGLLSMIAGIGLIFWIR
ncbi:MAG TPA: DUF2065 domain-containing protein [Gammaproteobacteria bacterium]|jgi:uncharacterized protein YjeT (DUF2065 family)|nr:DUF2065 domain-containing protein [Gammaproteobacteria bacterium]